MVENSYNPYYKQMSFKGLLRITALPGRKKKESEEESRK